MNLSNESEEILESSQTNTDSSTFSLGNIALSFSGGGYRASAFHLGVLDFLNLIGVLDQVTMLSTVSGGTITGAKYISELCKDPQKDNINFFDNFYNSFYEFLYSQGLPDKWINQLLIQKESQNDVNSQDSSPLSLIKAAANIYSESSDTGGLLGEIRFDSVKKKQVHFHIKEIIFNTTELHTGLGFRFRIGNLLNKKDRRVVGNNYFQLPGMVVDKIRLADVVAASSCFPGGFEPMLFPQDFNWPDGSWEDIKKKVRSSLKVSVGTLNTLPLTDGGIFDNLGVKALIDADEWLYNQTINAKSDSDKQIINSKRIGTLILSDTDNIGIDKDPENKGNRKILYSSPKIAKNSGFLKFKLRQVSYALPILFLLTLVSTIILSVGIMYAIFQQFWFFSIVGIWIDLILIIITIVLGYLVDFVSSLSSTDSNILDLETNETDLSNQSKNKRYAYQIILVELQKIIRNWDAFLKTLGRFSLADLSNLLNSRLLTVEPLFLSFLKNQQRAVYDSVYESTVYRNKAISCFIYDIKKTYRLLQNNNRPKRFAFIKDAKSIEKMADLADLATRTPTTLWFDENDRKEQIETLVACGQFTMCFNLIEHLNRKMEKSDLSVETQIIYVNALKAWDKFIINPKLFVGETRSDSISNFKGP